MIDSHCHLYFDSFDNNRDELIASAANAGVHTIINIGIDLESSRQALELAQNHEGLFATVGVHPHDARTMADEVFSKLSAMADHSKVVAIGEIGLDYYRDLSPRPLQKKVFAGQLELAVEKKLPVVIHTRDSFEDSIGIVAEYAADLPGGVFHCFPGTVDDAWRVFELGFIISVGGVITFGNNKRTLMAEVAAGVALDKLILETDAPFLTPAPFRGKQNQPEYVKYVYRKLAELKEIELDEVEKTVDRTCQKLFGLVELFGG
jgi:TatD DNase family protein